MTKIIYTDGCSLMAGTEHAEWRVEDNGFESCPTVWPAYMQQKYYPHAKLYQRAITGTSNRGIRRRTIHYLNELLTEYKSSDILVCIMWTSVFRQEFRLAIEHKKSKPVKDEQGFVTLLPSDIDLDAEMYGYIADKNARKEYITANRLDRIARWLYKDLHDPISFVLDTLYEIEATNLFLQQKRIKSVQYFAFGDVTYKEIIKNTDMDAYTKALWKRVLQYKIMQPTKIGLKYEGFYERAFRKGFKAGPGLHPLEDAHKEWLDIVDQSFGFKLEH